MAVRRTDKRGLNLIHPSTFTQQPDFALSPMASLQEVARRAKVSIATVSRVLNKSDKVVPDTRAVVERALRELSYRPSRVARRLRMSNGRAHLVGLIIPDIQNPFY